jgi:predicted AAA+ superfamily ATPase
LTSREKNQFLTPKGYVSRVTDSRLEKLLKTFGGVEIAGPKWCGKTWTALAHAKSVDRLDDQATFDAATVDAALVLRGEAPHLVDEWQEVPRIWDAARRHIDDNANEKGQLILTGSSAPKDESIHHSGTGRFAKLRMRPMTLFETGASSGEVSLAALFAGDFENVRCRTEISDIASWCCRGGWPSILDLEDKLALEVAPEYVNSTLDAIEQKLGLSRSTAFLLMRALASNLTQAATIKTLTKDMAADDGADGDGSSNKTINSYLDVLKRLYLIEDLGGWEPPLVSKRRVRTKPKRYFVDPSIAAALLGAAPTALLRDTQTLGRLFETLCLRDLRVYLSVIPGVGNQVCYYLDDKDLEVDIVAQLGDGRWGAFEVKLSDSGIDAAATNLLRLKHKVAANEAAQSLAPVFLAVLVGKGTVAYQRKDGIFVIPMACLGP